jgi:hypothetical protein
MHEKVGKPDARKRIWEDNIKGVEWERVCVSHLAQERNHRTRHSPFGLRKGGGGIILST